MSSVPDPTPEPTADELRLAELLARFQEMRRANPSAGIGLLREEAGTLFPELVEMAETMSVLAAKLGDDVDHVPAECGGYRILERIATGGVGVVYRAEAPGTGDIVALKVMRRSLALGGKAYERFEREIAVAERLDHPSIVPTIAHGESEGRLYLVMEFVDGCSLATLIRRLRVSGATRPDSSWLALLDELGIPPHSGPDVPAAEAYARRICRIFVPAADALARAAEAGLVHRDLKPANVLLRRSDGRLLVADFGVAKIEGDDITSTMAVLGTPLFMSPEQAAGDSRSVDARTDVYGLGATLYAVLTLDHPASGPTFQETLAAIVQKKPAPITKMSSEYPAGLVRLVSRCLEKDPRDRYPDAAALRDDLDRIANAESPRMTRTSPARRVKRFFTLHRAAAAAVLFVLVTIVAMALWLGSRPAELSIRTLPGGEFALNGVARGETPWAGAIESGDHEIVVTRDRFVPYRETIRVEAGQTMSLDLPLRPLDPFDRIALGIIMKAYGVEIPLPGTDVVRTRGGEISPDAPWFDRIAAVSPRDTVTPEGLRLDLRGEALATDSLLEIVDLERQAVVLRTPISAFEGFPPDRFRPGRRFRAVLTIPGKPGHLSWSFRVTDGRGLSEVLASYPESVRNAPHVRVMAISSLIDTGFFAEGHAAAEVLATKNPGRRLPLRLALEALEGLGLTGSPLYEETLRLFDAAEK